MIDEKTVNLIKLYERFEDPQFVMKGSKPFKEREGRKVREMYTKRTVVPTKSLGDVILATAYIKGYRRGARTILFLSEEQKKMIEKANIRVRLIARSHPSDTEAYICFPNRRIFQRIISM